MNSVGIWFLVLEVFRHPLETPQRHCGEDLAIQWRVRSVDLQMSFQSQVPMSLIWIRENFSEVFYIKKKKRGILVYSL